MDQRSEVAQEVFSDPPSAILLIKEKEYSRWWIRDQRLLRKLSLIHHLDYTLLKKYIIINSDGGSEIRYCSGSFL